MVLSLAACGSSSDNTSTDTNTDTTVTDPAEEELVYERGTVTDNTFSSAFLGASLTLDDSWLFFDDAQLAELAGLVQDSFEDEELRKQLDEGASVYEMYALHQNDNASVNITVQNTESSISSILSEDQYADLCVEQLPEIMASAGINVDSIEKISLDFAGTAHPALSISATVNNSPLYETIALVKQGSYIFSITCASYTDAATTTDLIAAFQAL